jgi:hypothetical protein
VNPLYRRRPDVTERRLGDSVFLARTGNDAVHRLNATGSALWRLLERPVRPEEAVRAFQAAFPAQPKARVARPIRELLAVLVAEGFVEALPPLETRA